MKKRKEKSFTFNNRRLQFILAISDQEYPIADHISPKNKTNRNEFKAPDTELILGMKTKSSEEVSLRTDASLLKFRMTAARKARTKNNPLETTKKGCNGKSQFRSLVKSKYDLLVNNIGS